METVHVPLITRTDNSYDIMIAPGLLARAGELIAPYLSRQKLAIVTDDRVAPLYLQTLENTLAKADIGYSSYIMPHGESSKSFAGLQTLTDWLLGEKIERGDLIIALGGGMIGDLAGFAASLLRRGIDFIQIPTTLLAQVDSAIGGKTAINTSQGKNLIGSFHQPRLVLADIDLLTSLPERQFRAGYAEILKYALLGDADFFDWLDTNLDAIMQKRSDALIHAIATSCRSKADIVARDEKEKGERALLNLGHTFAHAYEAITGYNDSLLHGEAVGLGMVMAAHLSERLGHCPAEDVARLVNHHQRAGLLTSPRQIQSEVFDIDVLIEMMAQDKKVKDGMLRFILLRGIGKAFIADNIDEDILRSLLYQFEHDNPVTVQKGSKG